MIFSNVLKGAVSHNFMWASPYTPLLNLNYGIFDFRTAILAHKLPSIEHRSLHIHESPWPHHWLPFSSNPSPVQLLTGMWLGSELNGVPIGASPSNKIVLQDALVC